MDDHAPLGPTPRLRYMTEADPQGPYRAGTLFPVDIEGHIHEFHFAPIAQGASLVHEKTGLLPT